MTGGFNAELLYPVHWQLTVQIHNSGWCLYHLMSCLAFGLAHMKDGRMMSALVLQKTCQFFN